ncbi:hypothetical protein QTP86_029182 [Hemibagrus guttatus]|nr:hypothetical protein QTP86_029182 [Hemibagrus guttatus]
MFLVCLFYIPGVSTMFEKQSYDSPPMYSPPMNNYGPQGSFLPPQSEFDPYPPPPGSYYVGEEVPQHFYKWTSPPGIIKIMEGAIVVLCLGIFACVASTLVWDMQYGGAYGLGSGYGSGYYGSSQYGSGYYGSGYYGSGYYGGYNYVSPYSAKSAMIAMAAINFIVSLAIFVATFSKTRTIRSRKFYLVVLVSSVILAVLQGIINIVYIVGVNPMAQSSANALYNPMLMMCQSLYGNSVSGMGGGFPLYNQYLYHYCYVDPQEAVAMVCGFLVVIALAVAAFFSYKTRSRIWRYGKPNVYWDEPLTGGPEGRDVEDWVCLLHSACPGSSPGSLPGGACPEHLPRETSRRHLKQMPEPPQLSPFNVEEQRLYSELLPGDRAPYPISKGAPATLRRKLISAA